MVVDAFDKVPGRVIASLVSHKKMFETISLTQRFQFISDCSLFSPSEEISVWVETVVLGCRRRLTAAVSVSEHSQPLPPPPLPAHFALGPSSLTWSWVLYETRSEFTEKSGAPPPVLLTQNWPSAPVLEIYSILFPIVFILKAISIRFTSHTVWYLSTPLFLWLNSHLVFFALFTLKKLKSCNIHVNLSKEVTVAFKKKKSFGIVFYYFIQPYAFS